MVSNGSCSTCSFRRPAFCLCGKRAKTRAGGKIHLGFERQGRAPARRDLPHLEDPHFYGRVLQDRRDLPFPASKPKSITLSARFQRIQASRTQRKAKKHRCRPEIVLARSGAFSENVRKSAENTRFGIKVGTEILILIVSRSPSLHGARGGSRTRTPLRALAPEASESTNSTTRASFSCAVVQHKSDDTI